MLLTAKFASFKTHSILVLKLSSHTLQNSLCVFRFCIKFRSILQNFLYNYWQQFLLSGSIGEQRILDQKKIQMNSVWSLFNISYGSPVRRTRTSWSLPDCYVKQGNNFKRYSISIILLFNGVKDVLFRFLESLEC